MRILFFFILLFSCNAQDPYDWVRSLPKPWTIDESTYDEILPNFIKYFPDFDDRLKAINIWRIGTPYGIFKSGEEKEPDLDPILRIDTTDCTIHVLTSIAMNSSRSWGETKNKMIDIHYKPNEQNIKQPEYKNRWHYTSDRILNNPYTVNITNELASRNELEEIELTLNEKSDGSEFLKLNWNLNGRFKFIRSEFVDDQLLEKLPAVCGVAFVKKSYIKNGILIAHEGFVIDQKTLIHASSASKKTIQEDLLDYLNGKKESKFDGVMFYKISSI